jgi:adenylosuccinate synthase
MKTLKIVLISGQVGSGKSTLASGLRDKYGATLISTKELLRLTAAERGDALPAERAAMQQYGTKLDAETGGEWVARAVAQQIAQGTGAEDELDMPSGLFVVDAVRIPEQIDAMRQGLGASVAHVHLFSSRAVLARRYSERGSASGLVELNSYEDVAQDPTEQRVAELRNDADIAVDTQRSNQADVLIRAAAALGLVPDADDRLVDILVGGQYGSEGKGNLAFYLAREYDLLVRVGGPNAGHKVPLLPDPYVHRQLPSGTQANPKAQLLIGPGATIDPTVLLREIADCGVDAERLSIDPQAMIIEAADLDAERDLVSSIASTGKGGGSAASRRILGRGGVGNGTPVRLARDVPELHPFIRSSHQILDLAYRRHDRVLLEGTQGTALSLYHGCYPHVTSRDTTTSGTLAEAGIGPRRVRRVIVVVRTYPIRVKNPDTDGATSGPMSQEISYEDLAQRSGVPIEELFKTETSSVSQRRRRIAEFDWDLLRRSVELNGATDIALTFADYIDVRNQKAQRYDQLTEETIRFVEEVERVSGVPVSLITTRFDVRCVIDRRRW